MHESWLEVLGDEFGQPYMHELRAFLVAEVEAGRRFYPPAPLVFNALSLTPFDAVRVVILGQDPYHGRGQAMGLCFSVPDGVRQPPSLQNIFRELHDDVGVPIPSSGDLTPWARQGVLLLNAVLTELSAQREGLVLLLWGRHAQQKGAIVDATRHHVLTAAHPSPYSASGFFGCRHFSRANAFLEQEGVTPIDWRLP
jgi:uracil-DNA glycosylase